MDILDLLRRALLVLSALVGLCYMYQSVYLVLPFFKKRRASVPAAHAPERRYAVLIAARNEQAVLPYLLDSIRGQTYPAALVTAFVLADNCTDDTAAVARAHGAVVYERRDTRRVGKGYALQALLEHIRADFGWEAFDAFLVFDADNLLAPDYIGQMDRSFDAAHPRHRPAEGALLRLVPPFHAHLYPRGPVRPVHQIPVAAGAPHRGGGTGRRLPQPDKIVTIL